MCGSVAAWLLERNGSLGWIPGDCSGWIAKAPVTDSLLDIRGLSFQKTDSLRVSDKTPDSSLVM